MTSSFYAGFMKTAEQLGVDTQLLSACLAEASKLYEATEETVKEAEEASGDPQFRSKLVEGIFKQANEGIFSTLAQQLARTTGLSPEMASGVLGGGGGALGGLLLSKLTGMENPGVLMLLSSLLGGAAGYGSALPPGRFNRPAPVNPMQSAQSTANTVGAALSGTSGLGGAGALAHTGAASITPDVRDSLHRQYLKDSHAYALKPTLNASPELSINSVQEKMRPYTDAAQDTWDSFKWPAAGLSAAFLGLVGRRGLRGSTKPVMPNTATSVP